MKKGRAASSPARGARELCEKEIEALTVAMVVAPGVYGRNRMFDWMSTRGAQRARTRAATVRGILRQLGRATAISVTNEVRGRETTFVLRYGIAAMRLTRVVELSAPELAALRVVAERANVRCLPVDPTDKELVAEALGRLLSPESEMRKSEPPRQESADADLSKVLRTL